MRIKYNHFFGLMLVLSIMGAVITLVGPVLINVWTTEEGGVTVRRILFLVFILVLSTALQTLLIVLRERFAKTYNEENFKKFLTKMLSMGYDAINEAGPTALVERVQIVVNSLYEFMTGSYIKIWSSVIVVVVTLGVAAAKSVWIAAIMLAVIPVNYFGYKFLNRELFRRSQVLQRESVAGFQKVVSYVGNVDFIKQCSDHHYLLQQLQPATEQLYGSMMDINVFAQGASQVLDAINSMAKTMMMVIGVYQYMGQGSSPVVIVLFAVLFPLYFDNISYITNINLSKQELKASQELIAEMESLKEEDGERECERIEHVKFDMKQLTVGERVLAAGIAGDYEPGDVVWVRGKSGKGKSTLVKLLVKFRECEGILINGVDLKHYRNRSVRARIAYLSQNACIVQGTLRENLFLNREWTKEKEQELEQEPILRELLKSKNMDTLIDENGTNLSGGEKQRVATARILQEDMDVFILDEITSNIDKESAKEIVQRIYDISRDKIVFIISHDDLPEDYANKKLEL